MPSRDFQWFWDKVDHSAGPNACWPWTGGIRKATQGYGRAFIGRKGIAAHRLALILTIGEPETADMVACHQCDNPVCCNPAHLWWGTQAENVSDCVGKGRKGNPAARRFAREELLRQREADWSYSMLAAHFGVNQSSIGKALAKFGEAGSIAPNGQALRARAAAALRALEGDKP